jgi:hypothetical protein
LAAKPIIDIVVAVADSADDPEYTPALEGVGYTLRIREPDWHEHRMFEGPDTATHVHIVTAGTPECNAWWSFATDSAPTRTIGTASPPPSAGWRREAGVTSSTTRTASPR